MEQENKENINDNINRQRKLISTSSQISPTFKKSNVTIV